MKLEIDVSEFAEQLKSGKGIGGKDGALKGMYNALTEKLTHPVVEQQIQQIEGMAGMCFAGDPGMTTSLKDLVNKYFQTARFGDPLVMDLDGDGIETISADGSVLFDHDGDGTKHGTGWAGADDGLLVHDLDGDGDIESGRELFGDATVKSDGTSFKFDISEAVRIQLDKIQAHL